MSRGRQPSTLALVGCGLVAYLIAATAYYWLVEPIRGKSYAALTEKSYVAPAEMPQPAAMDQQTAAKAVRLRSGLELPSSTALPAARAALAVEDIPERSVTSRPVKTTPRLQDASRRLTHAAHERPAQQTPPAFGWGSADGRW
jgi:hypothetical protein